MNKIKELYIKYKEVLLYLIFGVITTIINIATFYICNEVLHIEYKISNLLAWVVSVLFAFIANKLWVFESKNTNIKTFIKEISSFVMARVFSLLVDMGIMILCIDILNFNTLFVKILANIVVIIINYILSKFIIFKKEKHYESK